jgi:Ca2+-binding RTX toxin-like protein
MVPKIQNTDSIQTSKDGLDFDAPNETWIIEPDVIVFSESASGVSSHANPNNKLINDGKVYAAGFLGTGVSFNVGDGTVVNTAGAEIFGSGFGIIMAGSGTNVVNNFGDVISVSAGISIGIDFSSNTHGALLNNHGYVFGTFVGVSIDSNFVGGQFNNFDVIKSSFEDGIDIATAPNLLTNITNATGAIIEGASNSINVFAGMLHLANHGTVIGNISDTANVHDVIINPGKIIGAVHLGGGNDVFNGTGGKSGPIFGDDGNDRILGGIGNDQIHGGNGNDTLKGAPGNDRFFFDTSLNAATNVDRILDFTPHHDKIVLSAGIFTFLPLGALSKTDFHVGGPAGTSPQIDYAPGNGFLSYAPNGAAGASTHFATLANHALINLHPGDLLVA